MAGGINPYRAALRSNVRGLWTGALSEAQFFDGMRAAINRRLAQAAEEGASACGIKFDEFTPEEQLAMGKAIQQELSFVPNLAGDISENKRGKGKLTPFLNRVSDLWLNRYTDFTNRFKAMVCKDEKLVWRYSPIKIHCASCERLNGIVKRGSVWTKSGILPQSSILACGGWRCGCQLLATNLPVSKGPLPRI